ncbi:MAG TPA: PD-(D/E)XK nuclease family transposase, partial [Hymenobacter sp.]
DYGFKVTFGNEASSLFLRRALQALIQSDTPIEQVTFLPHELSWLTIDSRSGIYDLACQDAAGNFFIVEMQLSEYPEFIQRMKFTHSTASIRWSKKAIIPSRTYRTSTASASWRPTSSRT